MVEAIKNVVIVDRQQAPTGTRIEYRFKCDYCGYVEQGSPSYTTISKQGITELGSVQCKGCGTMQNPTFENS